MYTGWLSENAARAIATIPIIKTIIDVKVDILVIFDNNPVIPNTIIINPTIWNCNPIRNDKESM